MQFLYTHLSEISIIGLMILVGIAIGFFGGTKLKKCDDLWKYAIQGTDDGVWDWDIPNDIAYFSDQYKEMFGFSDTEIQVNMDAWNSRVHSDDAKSMDKAITQYLEGKSDKYQHEHRVICKDKSFKWVLSRGMIVKRDKFDNPIRMVGTHTDITERKLLETKLKNLAHFDALTGLPNRTLLNDRLKLALAYAKREKKLLAVMFVDLDQFKAINDVYGHKIGDKVLKKIAQRLSACVRNSDTVSRIGGDEFIILLPIINSEGDAVSVANKIVTSVAKPIEIIKKNETFQPVKAIQKNLDISASIGIAIYPTHGMDEKLLLINADLAMYQAKNRGKNQASLFNTNTMEKPAGRKSS